MPRPSRKACCRDSKNERYESVCGCLVYRTNANGNPEYSVRCAVCQRTHTRPVPPKVEAAGWWGFAQKRGGNGT